MHPNDLKTLVGRLRNGWSLELRREAAEALEALAAELANERARSIHSCGPDCTRDGCVNARLRAELAAAKAHAERLGKATDRETFIVGYCERSGITREAFDEEQIALPCDCGDESCCGWAAISRNRMAVLGHFRISLGDAARAQPTKESP